VQQMTDATPVAAAVEPRPKRYSRWRAGTLASVYVLVGLHIAHWKIAGRTLAPLELHEVMVTLELGIVTAGFLFMLLAFGSAAIFGRFFCSWGCHILALEDLCAWLLAKVGLRPRPVRSRMLLFVPPAALFYMFVWPQIERVIAGRPLPRLSIETDASGWASFVTTDFWRNLPPVGVTLFTFAVCGFLIVYVLGSRSFCRYACPYGVVFGLADRVAPGRLVALEGCTGCGTCTATCQSDIPVHQELAAYGTVMSSSCMKDLDCLSVCPSEAIGYAFTRPSLFRRRKVAGAPGRSYDFTLLEDAGMAAAYLVAFFVFRGLYGLVPFLLSLAIGGLFAYAAALAWRLLRRESVRAGRAQLELAGRLTRAGALVATILLLMGVLLAHSGFIRAHEWLGRRAFARVVAGPSSPALVRSAIGHLEHVERWGLARTPGIDRNLADLHFAAGEPRAAVPYLQRVVARAAGDTDARLHLARALSDAGRGREAVAEAERARAAAAALEPERAALVRAAANALLGGLRAAGGDAAGAVAAYEDVLRDRPADAAAQRALGELLAQGGRYEEAAAHFAAALETEPDSAAAQYNLAVLLAGLGREGEAIERYRVAARLRPADPETWNNLGFLLARRGEPVEAEACFRRAIGLRPAFAHPHFNLGRLLLELGREDEARPELLRAAELDPRYAEVLGESG